MAEGTAFGHSDWCKRPGNSAGDAACADFTRLLEFRPLSSPIRYGDSRSERVPLPWSLTERCYFLCGGSPISCTPSQSPRGHPGVHPPVALSVV